MHESFARNLFRILLAIPFVLATSSSFAKPGKKLKISSKRIEHFAPDNPDKKSFGKLEFLGGLELLSGHEDFGGISGFRFTDNDRGFLAVTDNGRWISGFLERDGLAPSAISGPRIGRLYKSNGKKLKGKKNSDAEGLELFGDTFLISFERNHRVERFSWRKDRLQQVSGIQAIDLNRYDLANNNGPEAIAFSRETGDLFVFPENDAFGDNLYRGFVIRNDEVLDIYVANNGAYSLTDASFMVDGSLIMLERHYNPITGVSVRIRKFEKSVMVPGARIEGEILLEAGWRNEIDNMEGLDLSTMEDGSTRLTLVSDDNFSKRQRTLILEFKMSD